MDQATRAEDYILISATSHVFFFLRKSMCLYFLLEIKDTSLNTLSHIRVNNFYTFCHLKNCKSLNCYIGKVYLDPLSWQGVQTGCTFNVISRLSGNPII